jgi:hypothetical protein
MGLSDDLKEEERPRLEKKILEVGFKSKEGKPKKRSPVGLQGSRWGGQDNWWIELAMCQLSGRVGIISSKV